MNGILLYDKDSAQYNAAGIKIYLESAKKEGLSLSLFYYEDLTYGVSENQYYINCKGVKLTGIDYCINRCRDYLLARHMEAMGIRVFNNALVNEIGNHKGLTYDYLAKYHIPMPDTALVPNKEMRGYLLSVTEQVVVKAVHGHGGSQVCLYHPQQPEQIDDIIALMGLEDVVVQTYVKGRGQDLRVYVIGNEIIGAVLRTATKDFRSNYSLGGKVESYQLSKQEISKVQEIMNCFSFDYVGIDFLILEDGSLLFNEIEDIVGARMLYQCSNLDPISLYVQYIARIINVNNK